MSYLVLARKYRPKTFAEMVGQGHVVQALSNALSQQRLHHAYLFTGTRGVGKTTVSRILAKSLNCQGPQGDGGITANPCGQCPACSAIDEGRFVDYVELDAASNRGVDEVQALLEQAVYKPVQGRFKVFMIDEVHMLTGHAFNAMLKTLEEPPEYLKFVLATTDPQKVPVTVLSRCLQFNLRPMPAATVQEHLAHVLQAEQLEAEPAALRLLARAARGSMRDALSLSDQAIAYGAGRVRLDEVQQMLGAVGRDHVLALIEALAQANGARVVQLCETLREQGLSAANTLEEMCAVLQQMAVFQLGEAPADSTDDEQQQLQQLARALPSDETQLLYSLCLHGRPELGLAPDEYAGLTMVLLRLLAFKPSASSANVGAGAGTGAGAETHSSPTAEKKTLHDATVSASPAKPLLNTAVTKAAASVVAPPAATATTPGVAAPAQTPSASPAGLVLPVREPASAPLRVSAQAALPRPPSAAATEVLSLPVKVPPELAQPEPLTSTSLPLLTSEDGDFWYDTVQQLIRADTVNAMVRELALQSQLVGRDEGHWLLRVERESLSHAQLSQRLQTALQTLGHTVALSVELAPVQDSPARRFVVANAEKKKQQEQQLLNDPLVQTMMRDFGAKILPGSIKTLAKEEPHV